MPSRLAPIIRHGLHVVGAAAATALVAFLSQNSEQITKAVPAHWQGVIASVLLFTAAIKYRSAPGDSK